MRGHPTILRLICGAAVWLASVAAVRGADAEGCLTCHQYRGLARPDADGHSLRLFYVNPNYYDRALGPHARLKCTDCHQRDQVEVFPHQPVSSVDCSRTCHLDAPGRVELRFSHQPIQRMLDGSAHPPEALDNSNQLLGLPLLATQSRCLLCHDEPTFRRRDESLTIEDAPVQRCNACHDEQLPEDTRYAYWHVHARTQPARSNLDVARLCATCHSNDLIRRRYALPDTTASYLASFHGKAALLGFRQTAGCLDCHVAAMENVHQIQPHARASAPSSAANLPDTCRTPTCHRNAGPQISSAAIHLDLATSRSTEYFIACLFVVLIVFTFGPSLLLTALKMLHEALGRHEPQHHEIVSRVHQLMTQDPTRRGLVRFTVHQRVQHWYLVVCFVVLALTGFPLKFAGKPWAAWLIGQFGGLATARLLHRWAGALLVIGFVYHAIYVATGLRRRRRQVGTTLRRAILDLPMAVGLADVRQMAQLTAYMVGLRRTRPEGGRFNPEEKFEYIGVFWGTLVLGTTGLLMWFNGWTSRHLSGRILTVAMLIHTFEAFLALLHVGVVHLAGVIFAPSVFPVSKAMFTGETPAAELAEGHRAMVHQVEQTLGKSPAPPEEPHV